MLPFNIHNSDILVVDDTPQNLKLLSSMLTEHGYRVRPAINGELALQSARKNQPHLILLDIQMPGLNGYEVCTELKNDLRTRDIPVIFLSALDGTDDKVKAFKVGGVDYITKPFQLEEVLARVEAQLTLHLQWRAIENFLRRERAYYEQLSEMKDDVVRTASHDLKNPIFAILGYTELIRQELDGALPTTIERYLDRIQDSTTRMTRLITDLLDLAQAESGIAMNLVETALNPLMENAVQAIEILAQNKGQTLEMTPAPTDLSLMVDGPKIEQVFLNLLSNAIKYTPEGGHIQLKAEELGDNEVAVSVADNGMGISEKDLPHLFERFYRISNRDHEIEGTGLGLAIVKAIVTQHNGRINVDSMVDQGSTFTVILPRA